jgi:hypothetical protein
MNPSHVGAAVVLPLQEGCKRPKGSTVERLLMFVGMTVGSYVGWWVGDCVGFDFMGKFLVSSLGSIIGIIAAWRIITNYLN